ncbi:lactate permease LctP family transporter [Heliobacterium chlorum]|uniref:L-lactate permease n=1 Tax=Heliobacterium chlorum TaxID=2698 RepID=A0ABR7SWH4_HELCL|nr:lactate permease LctP family transporter [Heliobacterium chlorum]MBC9782909.1 lactate permease LctP family transporter [Heliobacterium chlorum]
MAWTQNFNPMGNLGLSALVALIPIIFYAWALAVKRMKGHMAGLFTVAIAVAVAVLGFGMPLQTTILTTLFGALYGLFPIGFIVVAAVFMYNLIVKSGQFEVIKASIASITDDRRLQVLLIAFCFGAFLEGAAGFGTPVAIAGAMLVGLGFSPLMAAGLSLVANTAPVAYGGIGIPVIAGAGVAGLDPLPVSQMIALQLPVLSIFVPFLLVWILSGWKGMIEVWPAITVVSVTFTLGQWSAATFTGPMLADIVASMLSLVSLIVFLRVWKPKNVWRFPGEKAAGRAVRKLSAGSIIAAWSPFVILTALIGDWGVNSVKAVLETATVKFNFPGLTGAIIDPTTQKAMDVLFKFNWLSSAGTAIMIAAFLTLIVLRMKLSDGVAVFKDTLYSLRFSLLSVASVLGFAYIANYSGLSTTLGLALTVTGQYFPIFSPMLGWIGVFITGSDTSANALFCKLQEVTAMGININPILTVAANTSGGGTAKMISPQSIAVACGSVGMIGRESELFRFTLKYSLIFVAAMGVLTYTQAYFVPAMIPDVVRAGAAVTATASAAVLQQGIIVLAVTAVVLFALGAYVLGQTAKKTVVEEVNPTHR